MTNNNPAATAYAPAFGFGDGGRADTPLFIVNPDACPTKANEFSSHARTVINALLDEAILNDSMDSDTALLVQQLMGAMEAATSHAMSA